MVKASTNTLLQMTLQHIVKPTVTKKILNAILVIDFDITKFILFLIIDIKYNISLD
jgi:hypothetical protein